MAKAVGKEMHIEDRLHEGVYLGFLGPTYSTTSESRFVRLIGADAMGMSTTHETIVAKHAGLKVFALSLITDKVGLDVCGKNARGNVNPPSSFHASL